MSSGLPSDQGSFRPAEDSASGTPPADEAQQLLEQVLEATLELTGPEEPLGTDELRTLIAVSKKRRTDDFSKEIVTELVQTILRLRFRRLVASSHVWEKMTQQIAETLYDDPRSQERVKQLWTRLCEAAP